jgi:hypothetical protein
MTGEQRMAPRAGASDGTTTLSWKIVTTANCSFSMPFETGPIAIWNDTVGSPITATVEAIWGGGSLPLDSECWLEVEYLGTAGSPRATLVNDGTANLLATPAAQTASSATWTVPPTNTTLNPSDKESHITLSGGNLTALGTAGWEGIVRAVDGRSTGKFYWELTFNAGSNNSGVGVALSSLSLFTTFSGSVTSGHCGLVRGGVVYVNGSTSLTIGGVPASSINFGAISSGTVICIAIDMAAKLIWFRLGAGGNWNNSSSRDPATGAGGVSISSVTTAYPTLCISGADTIIANFGSTAFAGAVPSGFTPGVPVPWPPFSLSTPFTPAVAGWVYARVRCARPSSVFYVDPVVTLT